MLSGRRGVPALSPLLALVVACGAAASGCQSGSERPAVPAPYRRDIERVCDVVARSGAEHDPSPILVMAEWLGANLETTEGHDFLVAFQGTPDDAKAKLLLDEARRVGLSGCALAAKWQPGAR